MQAIAGRFGGVRKVALLAAVLFAAIAALVAVAPGVAHAAGSCSTTAGVTTCTFGPTGAEDTFTVPDGVSTIHVVATGAPGAVSATSFAAGNGAEVSGDLTVTPDDTLYVEVGGAPTGGGNCFSGVACVGGFNGGGSSRSGGGGGGASDVREVPRDQSGSLDSRLIVAAGGGGSGQGAFCRPNMTVFRGGAGGDAGSNGGNGEKCITVSGGTGGSAGGQSAGGSGGSPGGQNGSLGQGGNGGPGSDGGGGGGGLYGGGGGGSLVFGSFGSEPILAPAGGGGGGSNLVPTGGNATITESGPSITITYTPPNTAPVADDDSAETAEDTPTDIDVLSNDSDANDDALSAAVVSGPSHGSVSLNPNGSFTYTPNANYNGGDSFTYKASDGRGGEDTATVNITVNAINDAPVADNQSVSTNEDTDKGITLTATDAENDPLTFSVVDGPTHGTLSGTGANLTYHPAANYNGSDSFTYKANDGRADSNVATVSITVNAVNDAPVEANDSDIIDEDTPTDIAVLSNDTDDDGDTLSVFSFTQPDNGTVSENADGSLKYTPNADFNGADLFTYRATDGTEESSTAIVSILVDPVNDAPSFTKGADQTVKEDAGPQSVSDWATAISAGPSDEASQQVSFVVTNDNNSLFTSTGKPAISSEGTLTYTPAPDASGSAIVTVVLRDDGGPANGGVDTSAAQTFQITVTPVNDAPTVAVAAGGQCGTSGTSGQINLTVADVESAPGSLTLSATSSNQNLVPNSGLSVGGSGANRILAVTAAAKRTGTATITVRVSDGQSSGTVPITVKVGTDSKDTLKGTTGTDIIFGKNGDDAITGGDGNDLICGGNGAGTMSGGSGDDTLDGANGNDVLRGDAGKDILRGGAGDDTLTGGTEADSFSGGAGTDKATDFNAAEGDTKDATVP